jgi:hypothetical protein
VRRTFRRQVDREGNRIRRLMPGFQTAALRDATIQMAEPCSLPVRFAGEELQRYLHRMTGVRVPIRQAASLRGRHLLLLGPGDARAVMPVPLPPGAFSVLPENGRITLAGGDPRGVLDAVYALLEQCGCRWSLHGSCEERVPQVVAPTLELQPVEQRPAFAVRGYCSDIMTWHYTQPEHFAERLPDDRTFIDWMGKSGGNTFFFIRHPFDTQLTIPELLPEFERRGIEVEYGGHIIPLLLPRELFREHPEYFPASADGSRSDHGNVCTSSSAALAVASGNAVRWLRDYPEARVVHIWGADLWHGGWCGCGACKSVSVQDQGLRICNAVARHLTEAGLTRPICYLAYHDSIDANVTERPHEQVFVEFAPRERCYGHALNDPSCATNRRYAAALERYVDLFEGRVRLFEYYGDAILFFGCAVPLTAVIAADLAYYRRLGVPGMTMLQFGSYSLWAYPLNFVTYAAGLMGAGDVSGTRQARTAGAIDGYCARFGAHAGEARAVFNELEAGMQQVVTYGDIRRPPRAAAAAAPVLARVEAAQSRVRELARRFDHLGDAACAAQGALLRYTHLVLMGVQQELSTAVRGEPGAGGQVPLRAADCYAKALEIVGTGERPCSGLWGRVDLPLIHAFYAAAAEA